MTNSETPDAKLVRAAAEELRFGDYEGNLPDRLESLAERLSAPPLLYWTEDEENTVLRLNRYTLAQIKPRQKEGVYSARMRDSDGYIGLGTVEECKAMILMFMGLSASSVAGCAGETK